MKKRKTGHTKKMKSERNVEETKQDEGKGKRRNKKGIKKKEESGGKVR